IGPTRNVFETFRHHSSFLAKSPINLRRSTFFETLDDHVKHGPFYITFSAKAPKTTPVPRWNALSPTRWQSIPEGVGADSYAFGEYLMASSSEKPIHLFLNATVTSISVLRSPRQTHSRRIPSLHGNAQRTPASAHARCRAVRPDKKSRSRKRLSPACARRISATSLRRQS